MSALLSAYILLGFAIVCEVIGSTFLVKSDGFSRLIPSLLVILFFSIAFFLLSHVIKTIPMGIAYAIWSAVGMVLTAAVGYFIFKQSLDLPAMIGIAMIIAGVVVIHLFSNSTTH